MRESADDATGRLTFDEGARPHIIDRSSGPNPRLPKGQIAQGPDARCQMPEPKLSRESIDVIASLSSSNPQRPRSSAIIMYHHAHLTSHISLRRHKGVAALLPPPSPFRAVTFAFHFLSLLPPSASLPYSLASTPYNPSISFQRTSSSIHLPLLSSSSLSYLQLTTCLLGYYCLYSIAPILYRPFPPSHPPPSFLAISLCYKILLLFPTSFPSFRLCLTPSYPLDPHIQPTSTFSFTMDHVKNFLSTHASELHIRPSISVGVRWDESTHPAKRITSSARPELLCVRIGLISCFAPSFFRH